MSKYTKIIIIHIVLVYAIPCIATIIATDNNLISDYDYNYPKFYLFINCISTFLVFTFLIYTFKPDNILNFNAITKKLYDLNKYFDLTVYVYFILSVVFVFSQSNNFRYDNKEDTYTIWILITISIRSLVEYLIILDVICKINNNKFIVFGQKKYIKVILIISLYLSSHGIMPLLTSFLINVLYFSGDSLFYAKRKYKLPKLLKLLYLVCIFVIGIPSVYFVGWGIKTNSLKTAEDQFRRLINFELTAQYLVRRISVHYISSNCASEDAFNDDQMRSKLISNMISNLKYRFTRLTGIDLNSERPYITNTSRYNFERTFYYDKNIQRSSVGASSGVIGSLSYIFSYPMCSIVSGIYLYIVFSIMGFIKIKNKLPWFIVFIIWFQLRGFRANPGDFINFLDPNAVLFGVYFITVIYCIKK
jgi:hypothetical protein